MSVFDRLIGTWKTTMNHSAMSERVAGRQTYERMLGGAFVQQQSTYDHPDVPDAMALLSNDHSYYFDVRGIVRIFDLEMDDGGWSMIYLEKDFSQRTTARFSGPDVIESTGDVSTDNGATWEHDFTMIYNRVS
jgi:hypothetical protein